MKRLALYAHFGTSPRVAKHVLFCLEQLHRSGFQTGFISNSEISQASELELKKICSCVLVRENFGFDFCMWRRGLLEFDLSGFDELLLINSSIIGPLQPLDQFWQNPDMADCDFWGLTDNNEIESHLQSFFVLFRRQVFQSARFADFWRSVLPYHNKQQIIRSYEVGLTRWLEEGGFKWKAAFERERIWSLFLERRSLARRIQGRFRRQNFSGQNTTVLFPDLLLECGMPFLKAALLRETGAAFGPDKTFALLKNSSLPPEILEELRPEQRKND
jgi:rhamnosyltransferase